MLLSHLSDNLVSHLRLVLCTDCSQARSFGYYDRMVVFGLEVQRADSGVASNFLPDTQNAEYLSTVDLLHPCRIPRVGCQSKSCAAIITENEPGS